MRSDTRIMIMWYITTQLWLCNHEAVCNNDIRSSSDNRKKWTFLIYYYSVSTSLIYYLVYMKSGHHVDMNTWFFKIFLQSIISCVRVGERIISLSKGEMSIYKYGKYLDMISRKREERGQYYSIFVEQIYSRKILIFFIFFVRFYI